LFVVHVAVQNVTTRAAGDVHVVDEGHESAGVHSA